MIASMGMPAMTWRSWPKMMSRAWAVISCWVRPSKRVAAFNSGEPGFGISACNYMADKKIILTGADTWAVEAVPGENPKKPFECHVQMQTRHGIWNLENMDLTKLVADKAYEFLFVWSPLKIKGGTGSPGNPVALY